MSFIIAQKALESILIKPNDRLEHDSSVRNSSPYDGIRYVVENCPIVTPWNSVHGLIEGSFKTFTNPQSVVI